MDGEKKTSFTFLLSIRRRNGNFIIFKIIDIRPDVILELMSIFNFQREMISALDLESNMLFLRNEFIKNFRSTFYDNVIHRDGFNFKT